MTQQGHWPQLSFQCAFNGTPYTNPNVLVWTDITQYVTANLSIRRGLQYELAQTQTGQATLTLRNWDGRFDPGNTAGPYYPLKVWTPMRILAGTTPMFYGFVERWPQTWARGGNELGESLLTVVDAFAPLSQRTLYTALYHEIASQGASYLYPMDDSAPPTGYGIDVGVQFTDLMGGPPLTGAALGPLAYTPGVSLTPNPPGVPGPFAQVTQTAGNPGGSGLQLPAVTVSPSAGWTAIFAAEMSGVTAGVTVTLFEAGGMYIEYLNGKVSVDGSNWFQLPYGMALFVITANPWTPPGSPQFTVQFSNSSLIPQFTVGAAPTSITPLVLSNPVSSFPAGNSVKYSMLSVIPNEIGSNIATRMFNLFYGGFTDTSNGRYTDILKWASWPGPTVIDNYTTGQTQLVGDPMEILSATTGNGTNALQALQTVVDTETGMHFVDASGNIVFRSRRHNANTPDNPSLGTIGEAGLPYMTAELDYDPTHITNNLTITQTVSQFTSVTNNNASIAAYGNISMQRTVNSMDWSEIVSAGQFITNRYATPVPYGTVTCDLAAASAANWAFALSLEVGCHVTVTRTPMGSPAISWEATVEQISWTLDPSGKAQLQLGLESCAGLDYLIASQTRLTLNTAITAGATSMVVNALPDAAINGLDQNLGPGVPWNVSGGNLWLINDTNPEIIQFTQIPATGTGYTSATVQMVCWQYWNSGWQTKAAGTGVEYGHSAGVPIIDLGVGVATGVPAAGLLPPIVAGPWNPAAVVVGYWDSAAVVGRVAGY